MFPAGCFTLSWRVGSSCSGRWCQECHARRTVSSSVRNYRRPGLNANAVCTLISSTEDPNKETTSATDAHWPDAGRFHRFVAHHVRKLWHREGVYQLVDKGQYQIRVEKQPGSHARHNVDDRTNVGPARRRNSRNTHEQELQRIVDDIMISVGSSSTKTREAESKCELSGLNSITI